MATPHRNQEQTARVNTRRLEVLSVVFAAIPALGMLVSAAMVVWQAVEESQTEPVAGYTTNISMPAVNGGAKPQTVRQYLVHNPGPGTLDSLELRILLTHAYAGPASPPAGIYAEDVGTVRIKYVPAKGGRWTLCKVTPWHVDKADCLAPRESFGVTFIAPYEDWQPNPEGTVACLPGNRQIPAADPMPKPRRPAPVTTQMLILAALLVVCAVALMVYLGHIRKSIPRLAQAAVEAREADIRADAITQVAKGDADIHDLLAARGLLPDNSAGAPRLLPPAQGPPLRDDE